MTVFSVTDTIVAIATPPGRGGIGVVRLSGPDARLVAAQLTTHRGDFEPEADDRHDHGHGQQRIESLASERRGDWPQFD